MQPEPFTDPADDAAVARVRAGDVNAFELLIERHTEHVLRIVARNVPRAVVPEIAHESFVAAYTSLASYRPTRPFEHWLTRITLRTCSDYWRREYKARDRSALDVEEFPPATTPNEQDGDRELLEWALDRLDLENRQVITLVYFEDLSVKEAAAVLGWTQSKVKVRSFRARQHLRQLLERARPEL